MKRNTTLLTALTIAFMVVGVGVVMAATPPNEYPGRGDANDYPEYYEDFEDQAAQNWTGGSIVSTGSGSNGSYGYEADPDGSTTNNPIQLQNGTETGVFLQVMAEDINADIKLPGLRFATDSQSNSQDCDGNAVPGFLDFNGGWHNVFVHYNKSGYIHAVEWKPGNEIPNSWEHVTDTGCGYSPSVKSNHNITIADSRGPVTAAEVGVYKQANELWGYVYNDSFGGIDGATVEIKNGSKTLITTTTDGTGFYSVEIGNGSYTGIASKPGFAQDKDEIEVEGYTRHNFRLFDFNNSLDLQTASCLEHGQRATYRVYYTNRTNSGGDVVQRVDVTDNTTVQSENTSIVTVDSTNTYIQATNDTNVSDTAVVNATYVAGNGDTFTTEQNVTVAANKIKNFEILCTGGRLESGLRNSNIFVIIIATGIAVAARRIATVFAGFGAFQAVLVAGWAMGEVTTGIMLISLVSVLFIGLNVGANIDYEVSRPEVR